MRRVKKRITSDSQPEVKADQSKSSAEGVKSGIGKAILFSQQASRFKGLDLVLLDVSKDSSFADYFIICSGKSSRQVQGIADNLEMSLSEYNINPMGVEGRREGHWILMDYGDVIIHIFYEPVRYFYDLESLWSDAPRVQWDENTEELSPEGG